MSKECEICGRPIKTGRKYCWEHRHTTQANGVSSMKNLEKAYKRYKLKSLKHYIASLTMGSMLGCFFFAVILQNVILIILAFLLPFVTIFIVKPIVDTIIKNEIVSKNPKFIKFAESYGKAVKEKRDFRKSIFR